MNKARQRTRRRHPELGLPATPPRPSTPNPSPRQDRRRAGNRTPTRPSLGIPRRTPKNLPHPLFSVETFPTGRPAATSPADRAARAAERATRPTRRQVLAAVRGQYADPWIGRRDHRVQFHYEVAMSRWREQVYRDQAAA